MAEQAERWGAVAEVLPLLTRSAPIRDCRGAKTAPHRQVRQSVPSVLTEHDRGDLLTRGADAVFGPSGSPGLERMSATTTFDDVGLPRAPRTWTRVSQDGPLMEGADRRRLLRLPGSRVPVSSFRRTNAPIRRECGGRRLQPAIEGRTGMKIPGKVRQRSGRTLSRRLTARAAVLFMAVLAPAAALIALPSTAQAASRPRLPFRCFAQADVDHVVSGRTRSSSPQPCRGRPASGKTPDRGS